MILLARTYTDLSVYFPLPACPHFTMQRYSFIMILPLQHYYDAIFIPACIYFFIFVCVFENIGVILLSKKYTESIKPEQQTQNATFNCKKQLLCANCYR